MVRSQLEKLVRLATWQAYFLHQNKVRGSKRKLAKIMSEKYIEKNVKFAMHTTITNRQTKRFKC